jgi:hypothetical protein
MSGFVQRFRYHGIEMLNWLQKPPECSADALLHQLEYFVYPACRPGINGSDVVDGRTCTMKLQTELIEPVQR